MKIRNGFVSNSSSSSFVVQIRKTIFDIKEDEIPSFKFNEGDFLLPQESINLLKECGFKPVATGDPFLIEFAGLVQKSRKAIGDYFAYSVICNQDYVIGFLISHKISFKASIHYGYYFYSYDGGDEFIYVIPNFGIEYFPNAKKLEQDINNHNINPETILTKIPIKEFLNDYNENEALKFMGQKK